MDSQDPKEDRLGRGIAAFSSSTARFLRLGCFAGLEEVVSDSDLSRLAGTIARRLDGAGEADVRDSVLTLGLLSLGPVDTKDKHEQERLRQKWMVHV